MKSITIPERFGYPTLEITINGKEQTFSSGVEIEVEDSVAEAIENAIALAPKHKKFVNSSVDLRIDIAYRTVSCDIPLSDLFKRLQTEGYDAVNVKLYTEKYPIGYLKITGNFPNWLKVHYMYRLTSGGVPTISFENVTVNSDGTLTFGNEAAFISG